MTAMPHVPSQLEPITYSVEEALAVSGLKRTRLYELIAQRKIDSVTIGRRRLINAESLRRLLATGCD